MYCSFAVCQLQMQHMRHFTAGRNAAPMVTSVLELVVRPVEYCKAPSHVRRPKSPAPRRCALCMYNYSNVHVFVNTLSLLSQAHAQKLDGLKNNVVADPILALCGLSQWSTLDSNGNNAQLIPLNANTIMPMCNPICETVQQSTARICCTRMFGASCNC